jgi:hypothetical protein
MSSASTAENAGLAELQFVWRLSLWRHSAGQPSRINMAALLVVL